MTEPTDKQREDFAKDPRNLLWFAGVTDGEYVEYDDKAKSTIGEFFARKSAEMDRLKETDPRDYEAMRRFHRFLWRQAERIAHEQRIKKLLSKEQDDDIKSLDGLKPGDILEIGPPE